MKSQQPQKVDREKVRALKIKLGLLLNNPEGCLKVLKCSIIPNVDYPNPVVVAVRERFSGLMRRRRNGNGHFNRQEYIARYNKLLRDVENYSQREAEDFPGEYSWKDSSKVKNIGGSRVTIPGLLEDNWKI